MFAVLSQLFLQGLKVLVTPNTKPGKDIIANLVKAVQGLVRSLHAQSCTQKIYANVKDSDSYLFALQVVDRLGRSVLKNKKLPDDLLILSCEEDHMTCVPFLEKGEVEISPSNYKSPKLIDEASHLSCIAGGSIYSSELLLNGIVTQKLEYERFVPITDFRAQLILDYIKLSSKGSVILSYLLFHILMVVLFVCRHRLFVDDVKRTRSTIWVKKNNKFLLVTK